VRIDRLTLHTGPLSEAEARELARLVAEDIAALPLASAGSVRVTVAQPGAGGVASLREAVARAVESALTGDTAPAATTAGGTS
jgi:hypothetical protein